jgi:hypothetical protein
MPHYTLIKNCGISNAFVIFVYDVNMVHETQMEYHMFQKKQEFYFRCMFVSL